VNSKETNSEDIIAEMENEAKVFFDRLELLRLEQSELIKKYREKLEQRKLSQMKDELGIKGK